SSSMGNASTSVGSWSPRKRSWRSAIACSSTKITDISLSSGTRSSSSTMRANRTHRSTSTSTSDCSSAPKTVLIGEEGPGGRQPRAGQPCLPRREPGRTPQPTPPSEGDGQDLGPKSPAGPGPWALGPPGPGQTAGGSASALRVARVGVDDVLDDLVTDDVGRPELDEGEAVDALEDVPDDEQAGAATPLGKVDLGDVACHHDA